MKKKKAKSFKKRKEENQEENKKEKKIKKRKENTKKSNFKKKKNKKVVTSSKKDIAKVATTQVKKSFKNRHKKIIKTSYLVFILVFSILTVITINLRHFFLHPKAILKKSTPIKLNEITNETDFLEIQNKLSQNSKSLQPSNCKNKNILNNKESRSVVVNNKYLVVLKRGKIFVVNLDNNKYVTKTEVSPIPTREKEAVQYNNIYANGNTILVTGYRTKEKSMEVSLFQILNNGNIIRQKSYDLPSTGCDYTNGVTGDRFTSYTTRPLKTINFKDVSKIKIWDIKKSTFNDNSVKNSTIFYNGLPLTNPELHTVTVCKIEDSVLKDCFQKHFIDNKVDSFTFSQKNLYTWVSHSDIDTLLNNKSPYSLIYKIDLANKKINPKIVQVEGVPINTTALKIKNNTLTASIYQNNETAPTWLRGFTKNKLATFSINEQGFQEDGSIINTADDYDILPTEISYSPEINFISNDNITLAIDSKSSNVNISKNGALTKISWPKNIIGFQNVPETNKLIFVYKQDNKLYANYVDYSNNPALGKEVILADSIIQTDKLLSPQKEIHSLKINADYFLSLPVINSSKNTGKIYLLKMTPTNLENVSVIVINKNTQRLNDGCQNTCQEGWLDNLYFFQGQKTDTAYALLGSYLKYFKLNTLGKLQLLRTINYTLKPAPPKPKRPAAKIPGGAKVVNGRYVCAKKHDYVGKSKKNNKGYLHMDMECCVDPDEYPNPWCTYRPGELKVTKLRYADYHGKKKRSKH